MYQLSLLVLCAWSVLATAEETTCQSHRRNAAGPGGFMQWDIKCDNTTGKYEPLQCTVQTPKWCACYNEDEAVTQPSPSIKTCECYLARDRAMKDQSSGTDDSNCLPQCQRSGKFEKKQCCESRNGIECHCVDENTGEGTGTTGGADLECP